LSLLPLAELPLDAALVAVGVVTAGVVGLDAAEVEVAAATLLLTETAVTVVLLAAAVVVFDLLSLHTVSVLAFALRTCPGATALWARPWVTLWKFSLTSPSELEMCTTPALGA
jgi:hypothetical protein